MTNNDAFQWTDELVKQFVLNETKAKMDDRWEDRMTHFKASHTQQEPERIEVMVFQSGGTDCNNGMRAYTYAVSKPIDQDKFPSIKEAIEKVLNDDAPELGIPLPKDFVEFKNIAVVHPDGRKEELRLFTQSEIDNARKEGFEAARQSTGTIIGRSEYGDGDWSHLYENEYKSLIDYLNHLEEMKPTSPKPQVLFTTEDRSKQQAIAYGKWIVENTNRINSLIDSDLAHEGLYNMFLQSKNK